MIIVIVIFPQVVMNIAISLAHLWLIASSSIDYVHACDHEHVIFTASVFYPCMLDSVTHACCSTINIVVSSSDWVNPEILPHLRKSDSKDTYVFFYEWLCGLELSPLLVHSKQFETAH